MTPVPPDSDRPTMPPGHAPMTQMRWKMAAVLAFTIVVSLLDRMNITFAMPHIAKDYGWTPEETASKGGLLMSIFFISYGLANIFLTPWIKRFGARRVLLTIILLWSVFTSLGPLTSQWLWLFMIARVLLGLAESPHFPMMNALSKVWFPAQERSRGNSLWASGMFIAMLVSPLILVPLIDRYGWQNTFIFIALAGTLLSWPLVYRYVHDSPSQHPLTNAVERQHIAAGMEPETASGETRTELRALLLSPVFLLLCLGSSLHYILVYGIVSWMPTYLVQEKNVPYDELNVALTLPYVFSLLAMLLWSWLGDRTGRRCRVAAGSYLCAGMACALSVNTEGLWDSVVVMSAAVFFASAYNSCEYALLQRVVPAQLNTTAGGVYNGVSVFLGGGLGPVVVGGLVQATHSFSMAILCLSSITIASSGVMLVLSRHLRY
jgi:sugar phosphate permease